MPTNAQTSNPRGRPSKGADKFKQVCLYLPPEIVVALDRYVDLQIQRTGHHVTRTDVIREAIQHHLTTKEKSMTTTVTIIIERASDGFLTGQHWEEGYSLPLLLQRNNTPQEMQAAGYSRLSDTFPGARILGPLGTEIDPTEVWIADNLDLTPFAVREHMDLLTRLANERETQEREKQALLEPYLRSETATLLEWFVRHATEPTSRADDPALATMLERYRRYRETNDWRGSK